MPLLYWQIFIRQLTGYLVHDKDLLAKGWEKPYNNVFSIIAPWSEGLGRFAKLTLWSEPCALTLEKNRTSLLPYDFCHYTVDSVFKTYFKDCMCATGIPYWKVKLEDLIKLRWKKCQSKLLASAVGVFWIFHLIRTCISSFEGVFYKNLFLVVHQIFYFSLFFISFYISRYHFSQIFKTFCIIRIKDFCHKFSFLTDSLKPPTPLTAKIC